MMNADVENLIEQIGSLVLNAIGLGAMLGLAAGYFNEQPATWNNALIHWTGNAVFGTLLLLQVWVAISKMIRVLSDHLHKVPSVAIYGVAIVFTLVLFSLVIFLAAALARSVLAQF